jgi:hypothetical protein
MQGIEKLVRSGSRIRQQYLVVEPALFNILREGQHSDTRMKACCDSRAALAIRTDIDTGALLAYSSKKHEFLPACLEQHTTRMKA